MPAWDWHSPCCVASRVPVPCTPWSTVSYGLWNSLGPDFCCSLKVWAANAPTNTSRDGSGDCPHMDCTYQIVYYS